MKDIIIIATVKSWNIANAKKLKKTLGNEYEVMVISDKSKITISYLKDIGPRYIFFPHWSWIIPREVWEKYECIVFHMTDLPYGRGGSPLQNLITRKVYDTKVTALRVVGKLDAGPIYLKYRLSLRTGSAQDILKKASRLVFARMIPKILKEKPTPSDQTGKVVAFKRRGPEQSNIAKKRFHNLAEVYDFIRMLDGEGYPSAYVKLGQNVRLNFRNAKMRNSKVTGDFEVEYEKE